MMPAPSCCSSLGSVLCQYVIRLIVGLGGCVVSVGLVVGRLLSQWLVVGVMVGSGGLVAYWWHGMLWVGVMVVLESGF